VAPVMSCEEVKHVMFVDVEIPQNESNIWS